MQRVQCLDIGNSSTKFCIYEGEELCSFNHFQTDEIVKKPELISSKILKEDGNLLYCSVVPAAESSMLNALSQFSGKIHSISASFCAGIPISYKNKSEIGADRIANAIAAYYSLSLPAVIIDMGTATTFDIISKEGGYEGGIILPGPQGFLDFLEKNTALLPKLDLYKESLPELPFGKSTKDAMLIGVFSGYQSMIMGIVEKLGSFLGQQHSNTPTFTICGGSALDLRLDNCELVENLTLQGLRIANEIYYR